MKNKQIRDILHLSIKEKVKWLQDRNINIVQDKTLNEIIIENLKGC